MDIQTTDQKQSISDDQELAKVLAGVSQAADDNMKFEETGSHTPAAPVAADNSTPVVPEPVVPEPAVTPVDPVAAPAVDTPTDPALAGIKQQALSELRPLVDKLDVSPEEKFDTYLLLLRSTDDKDLVAPAHAAAAAITDEARRAQALLDIIKEIDYLSAPKQ